MNVFEMVILIVLVVMIAGVMKSYIERNKPKGLSGDTMDNFMDEMGLGDYVTKSTISPYLEKINALEERIKVLERIATDKGRNLSEEINRL